MLCTARSGSTLISQSLDAYGFSFREYLNIEGFMTDVLKKYDSVSLTGLADILQQHASVDGRLSTKIPFGTLAYMFLIGEFPENLEKWRFIYLRRENLVQQAISSLIAERTQQWNSAVPAKGSINVDDYDFEKILKAVNSFSNGNRYLERFIGLFGLHVYNITYETFLTDKKKYLDEMASFLGIDPADYPDAGQFSPRSKKQASSVNATWEERFRSDLHTHSIPIFGGT